MVELERKGVHYVLPVSPGTSSLQQWQHLLPLYSSFLKLYKYPQVLASLKFVCLSHRRRLAFSCHGISVTQPLSAWTHCLVSAQCSKWVQPHCPHLSSASAAFPLLEIGWKAETLVTVGKFCFMSHAWISSSDLFSKLCLRVSPLY